MARTAPTTSERRIDVPGAYNVRDLGGLPTSDGRTTKWGRFVRADLLSGLPAESQATLADYGIRTVVDLRTTWETTEWPSSFANHAELGHHHHNLQGDDPLSGYVLGDEDWPVSDSYLTLLNVRRGAVRDVLATIADGNGSPAVFFCAGGADRTGIIAALLLAIAGVSDEVIAEDYSLTAQGLVDRFLAEGKPAWMPPEDLTSGRALKTLARRDTMLEMLGKVRRDFGGVEPYLLSVGVTNAQIENIRDSFVE